jgi:hypothetical protein
MLMLIICFLLTLYIELNVRLSFQGILYVILLIIYFYKYNRSIITFVDSCESQINSIVNSFIYYMKIVEKKMIFIISLIFGLS